MIDQIDEIDLSRLPCNVSVRGLSCSESVRGEMPFSYLTGTSVIFLTNHRILNKVLSNAANRGSFLLNSNRTHRGVENKD